MTTTIGFLHNEKENEKSKTHIPPMDFRHVLITGATGSGKTASIVMPTVQDRISRNNAIILFDYKGHEHKKIKQIATENNRLEDVIELGKPTGSYFNILSLFDTKMIHTAIVKLCGGKGKDPYWSLSAGQLAVRIIELHRQIYCIGHLLINDFSLDADDFTIYLTEDEPDDYSSLTIEEEPSFATLAKILHTPKTLTKYFKDCRNLLDKLKKIMKTMYIKHHKSPHLSPRIQHLLSEILIYEDMVNRYDNFELQVDSAEAGGNNGVFQILNNAIGTLAMVDSINTNEINLMKKLEEETIVIIEMQSIHEGIYSIFIESLLQKLTARIKYGIPKNVSIFIDESNRVLSGKIDLHNDVLREARVELILAVQNQEQMVLKFGELKWQAISENILHHYHIDSEHQAFYDGGALPKIHPLIFSERTLSIAEKKYNSLEHNRMYLVSRFIYDGVLPKYFNIMFDSNTFFQHRSIELSICNGKFLRLKYIGSLIKEKIVHQINIYDAEIEEELNAEYEEIELDITNALSRFI